MVADPALAMVTFAIGFILWLIMFIIILKNEFKKPKLKVVWIVLFIFVPPSAILFPFIGMKQLK